MQPIHRSAPTGFPAFLAARPFWLLAASLALSFPFSASATLGEAATSTEADRASMKASLRAVPAGNYTIHEIQTPSGTTVREYVSPQGMVFAVAWAGPLMPDLQQALGRYFDRYAAAASARRSGRRQVAVRESDLVVQSGGHMRSFSGLAYLPQLLPQGVTLEELR
jgi:hypothetical protein